MGYAYLDIEISQCYCYGTLVKIHHPVEALYRFKKERYILLRALPRVCTENTARGGVSRDKYSTRRS